MVVMQRIGWYLLAAAFVAIGAVGLALRYAGRDPELRAVVNGLESEVDRFRAPMAPAALKVAYAGASYALRSRAFDGKALKSRDPDSGR